MESKIFSPSINIIRDFDQELKYIVTPNSNQVYNQIVANYQKGSRSFNIIGAYGTGKSSFILALEQSLNATVTYFDKAALFNHIDNFVFKNIIGDNSSLIKTIGNAFGIDDTNATPKQILKRIEEFSNELTDDKQALVIVVDEFGKFLEYAAANNPEKELYFIQQLSELVNDKRKEILFITILHQNFNAYSLNLSQTQIDEYNKVKGRFIELNFNEPVEQLLFLVAENLSIEGQNYKPDDSYPELYTSIQESKLLNIKDYNSFEFATKLQPFDLLSASTLTLALQEYAQNGRSVFTFIENDEQFGLRNFDVKTNPFYNLSCVYDYLNYYHYSFISTKYNPHLNQWNNIKSAIERTDTIDNNNFTDALKLVKTIGLLNIFSNRGGKIDLQFLIDYSRLSLGIDNPEKVIDGLIKHKIIRFSKYDSRYKLFDGTDLDFELAINEAGKIVERIKDVPTYLNRYFEFPVLAAKEVSYKTGTPRFFSFILNDTPVVKKPENEIDGFINLIINTQFNIDELAEISRNCEEAILFGYYTNTSKIEDTIYDIEKVKKVIEINNDDKVALQELHLILNHYKTLLNHYVVDSLYNGNKSIRWFFKGVETVIINQKGFNKLLSRICSEVYFATPVFKSELINKTTISGSISFGRKNLITRLLNNQEEKDLGFEPDKYPPEKSVFLAMIKQTGIYQENEGIKLAPPTEASFLKLWESCNDFLLQTRETPKTVAEFIYFLKQKPLKLKQGFIDFWLPTYLIINKDEFAIFSKDNVTNEICYVPYLNEEVIELFNKASKEYLIKKFDLTAPKLELFNKYREILNQIELNKFTNQSFIETFRPFISFYRSLTPFALSTKSISKTAINLRNAIKNAIDPEKAFFEDIPIALGYTFTELKQNDRKLEEFVIGVKEAIQEINATYDNLINEIEAFFNSDVIGEELSFPENKQRLTERYKKLKIDIIKPSGKIFYNRIVTLLNDRKSWINSITHACIGKSLENISDEEIPLLKHRILENIRELDSFSDLSESDIDHNKEELIKLEITSFLKGLSKKYIRIPKTKYEKISILEQKIKAELQGNDRTSNIALLTKLLQDELNNEE